MDLNKSNLRTWVLHFYCLSFNDQEKIRSNLTQSEREKLDELLAEIKAFGVDINTSILNEVITDDRSKLDVSSRLLMKTVDVISPYWYVFLSDKFKFFSDISLSKKPSYYKEYLQHKENLKDIQLAPKMRTALDLYFYEMVINECEE